MTNTKRNAIISIVLIVCAIVYTFLVKTVDVKQIGPDNTSVGFATVNEAVASKLPFNETLYKVTKYLGYVSLAAVGAYGLVGLVQLIKRKSLFKVDREIIALGIFFVIVLALYVAFEIVIVNYRPVILDREVGVEASFPSSHTVLAVCVCTSIIMVNKKLFDKVKGIKLVNAIALLVLFGTAIGRTLSGVHWISDIVGGIIISAALLMTFYTVISVKKEE